MPHITKRGGSSPIPRQHGKGNVEKPKSLDSLSRSASTLAHEGTFKGSKDIQYLGRGKISHKSIEVRGVRDTSHMTTEHLERMRKDGVAPYDIHGQRLELHHHQQKDHGEKGHFLIQVPTPYHDVQNRRQHPSGGAKDQGLPKTAREAFKKDSRSINRAIGRAALESRKKHE